MKYLLDTHMLLWYLSDEENLLEKAHKIIDTEECFTALLPFGKSL